MSKRLVMVFLAVASIGALALAPAPAAAQADRLQVDPGLQWRLGFTAWAGWRVAGRRGITH